MIHSTESSPSRALAAVNSLLGFATGGMIELIKNPDFIELMQQVEQEEENLAAKIYDSGTLLIIDDTRHRIVPKFKLQKKINSEN